MSVRPTTSAGSSGSAGGDHGVTRRAVLRSAAGAAALGAFGRVPAWAKPIASLATVRKPDSLPFPHMPAGTPSMPQIKHIVCLMMENHSFDNFLGMVPFQVPGRSGLDGLTRKRGRLQNFNPDASGQRIVAHHASSPCQPHGAPSNAWNASHISYNGGRNDGFVRASGDVAMEFSDQHDIPFTYSLVKHFPIGERYFCSTLCQTYPNRRYFFTGTSSGLIATNINETLHLKPANGDIFDRLDAHHINFGVYFDPKSLASWLIVPDVLKPPGRTAKQHHLDEFFAHAAAGKLPPFTFLDPNYGNASQEDPQDIQVGEQFIAKVVNALMKSPNWQNTALFINYDEGGGYYDHVPPPRAIKPDSIPPMTQPGDQPGAFDRYGFRVPLIVVSPWARPNYISRVVQDHTSVTAFIERKWNLPAMTFRDANAHPMTDYFDFSHAAFAKPPKLAAAPPLGPGLTACKDAGFPNPPLPSASASDRRAVDRALIRAARR